MDRLTAQALLPMVNDVHDYEALKGYVTFRTKILTQNIAGATDLRELGKIQGALTELNRILGLREECLQLSRAQ